MGETAEMSLGMEESGLDPGNVHSNAFSRSWAVDLASQPSVLELECWWEQTKGKQFPKNGLGRVMGSWRGSPAFNGALALQLTLPLGNWQWHCF